MASIKCYLLAVTVLCMFSVVRTQVRVNEIKLPANKVRVNEIKLPANKGKNITNTSKNPTTSSSNIKPRAVATAAPAQAVQPAPKQQRLVCPAQDVQLPLFTLPCERNSDCGLLGQGLLCCARKDVRFKRCLKGLPAPKPEPLHEPWLRIFPRKCPESPIAEFREVKNCTTDTDCTPRICCPEKGTSDSYCRTAAIMFDQYPTVQRMIQPITSLAEYFQCSTPPAGLDFFQKECSSALDCFPNLCCQERGRRVCRPPRQSVLTLFAGLTRRVASSSTQMTNNLINSIRN